MHVQDAGQRIADVCLDTVEGAVNICSGKPVSLAELARSIAAPKGAELLLDFGALPDRPGDPKEIFGVPYLPHQESSHER
ncbi:MAG: hypothetical protein Rhims3KO_24940 [Hyphomicrobiales bacterium]